MVNKEECIYGNIITGYVTGYSFDELSKYRRMIEDNPDKYQQNQRVVDRLYQGLHHSIDSMGELTCEAMAQQEVLDTIPVQNANKEEKLIRKITEEEMEKVAEKTDLIREHITAHADALQHLLNNKALSNSTARLLENIRRDL